MAGYAASEIDAFLQHEMELLEALDGAADGPGEPDGNSQYLQGPMQLISGGGAAGDAVGEPDIQGPMHVLGEGGGTADAVGKPDGDSQYTSSIESRYFGLEPPNILYRLPTSCVFVKHVCGRLT